MAANTISLDLLRYHDFHHTTGAAINVGDEASAIFGPDFEGLRIVSVGPPIHEGKDMTVVVAHSDRAMERMQEVLDGLT